MCIVDVFCHAVCSDEVSVAYKSAADAVPPLLVGVVPRPIMRFLYVHMSAVDNPTNLGHVIQTEKCSHLVFREPKHRSKNKTNWLTSVATVTDTDSPLHHSQLICPLHYCRQHLGRSSQMHRRGEQGGSTLPQAERDVLACSDLFQCETEHTDLQWFCTVSVPLSLYSPLLIWWCRWTIPAMSVARCRSSEKG